MPPDPQGAGAPEAPVPSMLDLIRLSPRIVFPPGGVDLYRQIALLTDMAEGDEVLSVACGKGVSLEYFVREHGVHGSGVEPDARLVEVAESRTRDGGLSSRIQFQTGMPDSLPYRDEVFDVAVGELGLAARADPATAVRELARVTRPGGTVVLVQLAWRAPVDPGRARVLAEHLGARPLMLVEWKRHLKEAGVEELQAEEWSDEDASFRARVVRPFPDFAEIFTLTEKVGVLRRAWARWGLQGMRAVLVREREVHKLLTRERILGLVLLRGRKQEAQAAGEEPAAQGAGGDEGGGRTPSETGRTKEAKGEPGPDPAGGGDAETAGLPLFGGGAPGGDAGESD